LLNKTQNIYIYTYTKSKNKNSVLVHPSGALPNYPTIKAAEMIEAAPNNSNLPTSSDVYDILNLISYLSKFNTVFD
jgi:hypothetical protein